MVQLDKAPKPSVDMAARRRKNKRILIGLAIPLAFIVGISLGAAGNDASASTATPMPTPTVTITAKPKPAVTMTAAPVISYQVPAQCLVALDRAEDVVHAAGGVLSAVSKWDVDALDAIDDEQISDDVREYNVASTMCRAA